MSENTVNAGLRRLGYTVLEAADGKAARDAVNTRPGTPGYLLFLGTGSHIGGDFDGDEGAAGASKHDGLDGWVGVERAHSVPQVLAHRL